MRCHRTAPRRLPVNQGREEIRWSRGGHIIPTIRYIRYPTPSPINLQYKTPPPCHNGLEGGRQMARRCRVLQVVSGWFPLPHILLKEGSMQSTTGGPVARCSLLPIITVANTIPEPSWNPVCSRLAQTPSVLNGARKAQGAAAHCHSLFLVTLQHTISCPLLLLSPSSPHSAHQ
ncbi:hypothetical protein SODALDRAFT_44980 [Sodiomyces alkalinus F11]|uniref:Uncharacterized protein n=1 Tax=Sodiomyces alkalinus (strain CBS 110278 / VKM F-3762 / F11) TaxID=1314773 RepID=A0A3N2QAK5_SODAK|nr:hypothetical protein SODALDRAFT_44980 [Sodiomyces alkalinus F11]ROT43698.1 hypothetical protein SODALDRAFT_44980 [Sodiomyces alkalinus F11]